MFRLKNKKQEKSNKKYYKRINFDSRSPKQGMITRKYIK